MHHCHFLSKVCVHPSLCTRQKETPFLQSCCRSFSQQASRGRHTNGQQPPALPAPKVKRASSYILFLCRMHASGRRLVIRIAVITAPNAGWASSGRGAGPDLRHLQFSPLAHRLPTTRQHGCLTLKDISVRELSPAFRNEIPAEQRRWARGSCRASLCSRAGRLWR